MQCFIKPNRQAAGGVNLNPLWVVWRRFGSRSWACRKTGTPIENPAEWLFDLGGRWLRLLNGRKMKARPLGTNHNFHSGWIC